MNLLAMTSCLGIAAIHPISGESVPVFVADYVVGDYADGAVMGVPAHDERDHAFAVANELPIRTVVTSSDLSNIDGANVEPGTVINSGEGFDGLSSADATEAVAAKLQAEGKGGPALQYRLRDWLVSRQRYWGAPIPMVHCESCGVVPVPEADLPVTLPEVRSMLDTMFRICVKNLETWCPHVCVRARAYGWIGPLLC